ncbi:MAG: DEAD/DEAH box helicase family protein, partial [Haloplanus sp.]
MSHRRGGGHIFPPLEADGVTLRLRFADGAIVLRGEGSRHLREAVETGDCDLPADDLSLTVDDRSRTLRVPAHRYADLRDALDAAGFDHEDRVFDAHPLPLATDYDLRDYQSAALDAWEANGCRGVLELPTGSGKTVVAVVAIATLGAPTLVVVPTVDLLIQWRREVETEFGVDVGQLGGGEQRVEDLTVATYDSAYLRADEVGDRFEFAVFDEVHHLGAEGYRDIARLIAAPARLGLTATFERP